MPGSCAPDYGNSNPCDGAAPSLIREQGRPGPPGVPGGQVVFEVGTVVDGGSPSVTYTMVNPLLYRVDYVLPSAGKGSANTWTALQTFAAGIASVGITDTGTAQLHILLVSAEAGFSGATEFTGPVTMTSSATFLAGITASGDSVVENLEVTGTLKVTTPASLAAGEVYLGYAVYDSCGNLKVTNGVGPNSASGGNTFSQTVLFNSSETAIGVNIPFTIPNVPACGTAPNIAAQILGQLQINIGGALPADVSTYAFRIRLDNASTGTVLYSTIFSNLQAALNWFFITTGLTPGAHTLYFTVQGLGAGSSSVTLTALDTTITF